MAKNCRARHQVEDDPGDAGAAWLEESGTAAREGGLAAIRAAARRAMVLELVSDLATETAWLRERVRALELALSAQVSRSTGRRSGAAESAAEAAAANESPGAAWDRAGSTVRAERSEVESAAPSCAAGKPGGG